jgi:hypothetical protein
VITNETARGDELHDVVLAYASRGYPAHVLVVAPALNARLRQWHSDDAGARRRAVERVVNCVGRLADAGVVAEGTIGNPDPLQAIEDALGIFPADRMIIATRPEGSSNWLARNLLQRAERRFGLPLTHVVVDTPRSGARRSELAAVA